jgi:medium-chain acyl-[acyl-carrier-protein] hydrolase
MPHSPMLRSQSLASATAVRLVCLPYAGGGLSAFRTWSGRLLPNVDPLVMVFPGRGPRLRETPATRLRELAASLASVVEGEGPRRLAFFGHSLGALLAFEIVRELTRRGAAPPIHLFVSSRRGPRLPEPGEDVHKLPDAEFVDEVQRRYDAVPEEVRSEPELMELLLPALRADFEMLETYEYVAEPPLECPITAISGLEDDRVPLESLQAWRDETVGPFRVRRFPGGHFYFRQADEELAQLVRLALVDGAGVSGEHRL